MIEHLDISGVRVKIWDRLEKYIYKKIGKLDRLLPSHAKKSVRVKVILSESNDKKKMATCEVIMELPHVSISAKESTTNMFSSVDIVEAKLSRQIRKYKTVHTQQKKEKRLMHKLLGKFRPRR